jgi:hypothetical protein
VVDTGLSNFTAQPGSLEWSLTLRHWPFVNPSNTLLLEFGLSHFASASGQGQYVIDEVEFVAMEKTHRYTLRAVADGTNTSLASGLVIKLIMPLVATVDGVARSIDAPVLTTAVALAAMMANTSALSGSPVSALQAARGDRVDTIAFAFPSFSQSLTYDPNLGLLVGSFFLFVLSLVVHVRANSHSVHREEGQWQQQQRRSHAADRAHHGPRVVRTPAGDCGGRRHAGGDEGQGQSGRLAGGVRAARPPFRSRR